MKDKLVYAVSIVVVSVCLKTLLIPSYTSTDFEVHRNWLAITCSLPLDKWYFEDTSEWTLDYPPFFAWFEKALAQVAVQLDPNIVNVTNTNYKSDETLLFQRGTVILSDLVLAYSAYKCSSLLPSANINIPISFFALLVFNCGLLIVDHMHFQYNGFLFSMLFLSLYNFAKDHVLWSAFWFAVLLNFKHIFLYIAPAYGVFLLRVYCMNPSKKSLNLFKFLKIHRLFYLATIVVAVFCVSFGPFFTNIEQVLKRLFPFKRGLTHAYWAPNFWALYNAADRVGAIVGKRCGLLSSDKVASSTGGLVQTVDHVVLPSVPPFFTFVLTFFTMVPCLLVVFFKPKAVIKEQLNQFLRTIVLCSLCSFLFGWHVHEKAILMAILPFTLLAFTGKETDARIFLFLQAVGHYSLFPLLFTSFETVIKICLALFYSVLAFVIFKQIHQPKSRFLPCLSTIESLYVFGLVGIEIFCNVVFPFTSASKYFEFLPLMLISTYCSFGVVWSWILLYKQMLFH